MAEKDKVLRIRISSIDLEKLKKEASIRGIPLAIFVRAILSDYLINEQAIKYVDIKLKPKVIKYWMNRDKEIQTIDNNEKKD